MNNISGVYLAVPYRIHSFVTEFGKMFEDKNKHCFGGGLGFSVASSNSMLIRKSKTREINAPYKNVVSKFLDIFKSIYSYSEEFTINLENDIPKHYGFGSTIVVITSVCAGLNFVLGNKLSKTELNTLIFENYCEEDKNGVLVNALTSGIGGLVMLYGGMVYMDNGVSFARTEFNEDNKVVLFTMFQKDKHKIYDVYDEFEYTDEYIESDIKDKTKKKEIIYNSLIPSIINGDFVEIGNANDILNEIGSGYIDCKQFEYLKQKELFSCLRRKGAELVGISSAGPTAYAVIKKEIEQDIVDILVDKGIDKNTIKVYDVDNKGLYVSGYF